MKTKVKTVLTNEHFLNEVASNLTFDTFIEGECNRNARLTGMSLIKNLGNKISNPLIIYSEEGCGKTHLAQAIFNEIIKKEPGKKVEFINCYTFLKQYVTAIRKDTIEDFENFYLQYDALVMDDINYLEGKNKTQHALLQLFDGMLLKNRQIVFTSSVLPKNLLKFEQRFISRLKSGLTICLSQPDFKTRVEILKHNVASWNISITENVIMHIAKKVDGGIREMQGATISIAAYALTSTQNINIELADRIIEKL